MRRLVSHWADTFDWRAWERKLNTLHHFTWEGIHFVHQRAASGRGVPLILTHGWPSSFLDYVDMLPMLGEFDVVVPSLPGYGFSPRPPEVGINYRYVAERWHSLMTALGNPAMARAAVTSAPGYRPSSPWIIPKLSSASISPHRNSLPRWRTRHYQIRSDHTL